MKKKLNRFLFEGPPAENDFENLQSKEKPNQNYSSVNKVSRQGRDTTPYKVKNDNFASINNNEITIDKGKKGVEYENDLYDLFEKAYENLEKAQAAALELENNPSYIENGLNVFVNAFSSLLKFNSEQYKKHVKFVKMSSKLPNGATGAGLAIKNILIGNNPVFRETNGGYTLDSKLIDNFLENAIPNTLRITVYGNYELLKSGVISFGQGIASTLNFVGKAVDATHEGFLRDSPTYKKACNELYNASTEVINFLSDERNIELMRMALLTSDPRSGKSPIVYNPSNPHMKKLANDVDKINDDKKVEKELNLTKDELILNRNISRDFILNTVLSDIDDDDEKTIENNKKDATSISDLIAKSIENLEVKEGDTTDKKDIEVLKSSIKRLKSYKNYTPQELIENPSILEDINENFTSAMTDFEKNQDKFEENEIKSITQFISSFKKIQPIFPEAVKSFNKIKQDPKVFENIKVFYKNQGIFNLSTNLDTLTTNYKKYLETKRKQESEILNDPLRLSTDEVEKTSFRKNLFLLTFHVKLIDMIIYFLNRFSEKILNNTTSQEISYRGNKFLLNMYKICLEDVNLKTMKEQKYSSEKIGLEDIVKNFDDLSIITKTGKLLSDKMLSVNDKLVGFYSSKKREEKIGLILKSLQEHYSPNHNNPSSNKNKNKGNSTANFKMSSMIDEVPIQEQEPEKNDDIDFELQRKLIFTKIEVALKKIPLIDTIVLLTNKNSTGIKSELFENDYFLYEIDISNLYDKIFNEPKLWDYIMTLNKQENNNKDFKIEEPLNISEELRDFSIFDLREYINISTEEKISIKYDNIEINEKGNLDFTIESFQFLNKQIANKKDPDLNPIQLIDLFKLSGLDFLTQNKNIFIDV
jgi:hypothetical protein